MQSCAGCEGWVWDAQQLKRAVQFAAAYCSGWAILMCRITLLFFFLLVEMAFEKYKTY